MRDVQRYRSVALLLAGWTDRVDTTQRDEDSCTCRRQPASSERKFQAPQARVIRACRAVPYAFKLARRVGRVRVHVSPCLRGPLGVGCTALARSPPACAATSSAQRARAELLRLAARTRRLRPSLDPARSLARPRPLDNQHSRARGAQEARASAHRSSAALYRAVNTPTWPTASSHDPLARTLRSLRLVG